MSQKSGEKLNTGTSTKEGGQGGVHITDITDKTFSVIGSTGVLREQLKELGGKYSAKHKGYDFSHKKRETVEKLLHGNTKRGSSSSAQTPSKKSRKTTSHGAPAQVSQEEHGQPQQPSQEHGQMAQEDIAQQQEGSAQQEEVPQQEAAGQPSASEAEKSVAPLTLSQKPDLNKPYLVHYSPRNFAVIGDAERYRADLEKTGCKHQAAIKIGSDKYAGWTFHQSKVESVRGIIKDITELAVHLEEGGGGGQGAMEGAKAGAAGGSSSSGKRKAAVEGGAVEGTPAEA